MKPKLRLWAALCAASCLAFTASATGESISINIVNNTFASLAQASVPTSNTSYGLYQVPGRAWVNRASLAADGVELSLPIWCPDEQVRIACTRSVTFSGSGLYTLESGNTSETVSAGLNYLVAYIDDGNPGAGITIPNVPFAEYTVYVYAATDTADRAFAPITVNGTAYTYKDGQTVAGETAWGASRSTTVAEGTNALIITGQTAATLTIHGGSNQSYTNAAGESVACRGGIAAVQIVNTSTTSGIVARVTDETFSTADTISNTLVGVDGYTFPCSITFGENVSQCNLTVAGETQQITTSGERPTFTVAANAEYSGDKWWWDYEFNNSLDNTGYEGTGLNDDTQGTSYNEAGTALKLKSTPHRSVSSYPSAFTAVLYGTAGTTAHGGLLSFGTKSDGAISLVGGDNPGAGQMRLIYSKNTTVTELVSQEVLTVPNATTTNHLYAFSKYTEAGKTVIDIYLDGRKVTKYTFNEEVALGGGFQVGSMHGGTITGHLVKCEDDAGMADFLRVSDEVLTPAALQALAGAYPYNSPSGTATRTFATASSSETWVDATNNPWTQMGSSGTSTTQAAPSAGTNVQLTVNADTSVALNHEEAAHYESLRVSGTGALTLTAAEGAKTLSVSDLSVNTDLTLPLKTVEIGTLFVGEGCTLTLDGTSPAFVSYCSGVWEKTSLLLTGVAQVAGEVVFNRQGQKVAGRTVSLAYDSNLEAYTLTISAPPSISSELPTGEVNFSALTWTSNDQTVTPDWANDLFTPVTLTLSGDTTLIFDKASAVAVRELILAGSGTLTLQKAAGAAAFSSQTTRVNTSVEVEAGALSLGKVVLGPSVSLTLHESTYALTAVSAATDVTKATRPTVILASDCTLTVSQALSSALHNFNLTIAEGTTCTTSGRWDLCGTTVTVAGTLKKAGDFWFGVSYGSLNDADSALVVTSTGEVTQSSGVFYIGAWGNTSLNTVSVAGACTLNTVQYHGASTVGFSVEEGGVLTVKGVAGNSTAAFANVSVEQGGTLAWKDTLSGTLTFADGAQLDTSAGVPAVTGDVSFAGALKVKVAEMPTAASTLVLSKAGLSAEPTASTVWVGEAEAKTLFVAVVDEGLAVKLPQVPAAVTEQAAVEALQAFAAAEGLAEVTALSGQTSDPAAEEGKRTLSEAELNAALACFSGVLTAGESAGAVVVAYDFGVAAVTPVYAVDGTLLRIDVKVKVQGPAGAEAGIAQGVKLRLVDGAGTLIPDYTMDYSGGAVTEPTFTPVENEAGAYTSSYQVGTLLGKQIRVRATNE